ncbi:hypothetical protein [Rhodococcoides fascians]|uniref:hypothetical protein n=1 Tax=Rhodococcoides fascians TaxID=1828 RepID=UPI00050BF9D2|nr:hypothetical protein [Rhodococcus fascians]
MSAPDNGDSDERLLKTADEVRRTIEANQRAEQLLFVPSPVFERLLWQVSGAWETAIEEIRFLRYATAETPPTTAPFVHPDGENVARDMRRMAKNLNLVLPNDTMWTDEVKRAKAMRDDLGHMLHFKSMEGVTPNQTATILRVAYKEPDEMSTDGGWARHERRTVTITEQDARAVLAGLQYVNRGLFALRKFGVEFSTWPDDRSVKDVLAILPWWVDAWGSQLRDEGWTAPAMRQLRIRPKAEFDASLPPEMRPEF